MSEKWIAVLLTLSGAMIFLTGYTYLDGYFDYFDVAIGELGFDIQNILVHSAPVLLQVGRYAFFVAIFLFIALIATYYFLCKTRKNDFWNFVEKNALFSVSIFLFGFVIVGLLSANSLGLQRAAADLENLNRMSVSGLSPQAGLNQILASQPSARLHHLVTTQSTIIGVIRFRDGDDRWVVRLPKSQDVSMRVYQESEPLT